MPTRSGKGTVPVRDKRNNATRDQRAIIQLARVPSRSVRETSSQEQR